MIIWKQPVRRITTSVVSAHLDFSEDESVGEINQRHRSPFFGALLKCTVGVTRRDVSLGSVQMAFKKHNWHFGVDYILILSILFLELSAVCWIFIWINMLLSIEQFVTVTCMSRHILLESGQTPKLSLLTAVHRLSRAVIAFEERSWAHGHWKTCSCIMRRGGSP